MDFSTLRFTYQIYWSNVCVSAYLGKPPLLDLGSPGFDPLSGLHYTESLRTSQYIPDPDKYC